MKLSSLLLSSAAVLVAGSAFAADLPSKKAAPASAVTVCKVGDTTGIALPGGDTCLKINGRVTADISTDTEASKSKDGKADYSISPAFRVGFDALSNTEIGVVRSFVRIDGSSKGAAIGQAYAQFSGVTVGVKDSLTDIYGTTGNKPTQAGNSDASGIDYQLKAGNFGLGLGIEYGADNNTGPDGSTGDRPNFVGQISAEAGPVTAKVAAASHQAYYESGATKLSKDGYAVKGSLTAALGQVNLIAFGGTAEGASAFIGGFDTIDDLNSAGKQSTSTSYGAEVNTKLGNVTVALEAARYENKLDTKTEKLTEYGVFASYAIAKGLSVQPELYHLDRDGTSKDSNIVQVRIKRDF